MKKFFLLIAAALLFLAFSCKSAPKASSAQQRPAPRPQQTRPVQPQPVQSYNPVPETNQNEIDNAFDTVYSNNVGSLDLTGAKTHTVKYRDTLTSIAKTYYGRNNGYYFPIIMLASKDIVLDPDLIIPGMQLTIPDFNRNVNNEAVKPSLKRYFAEIANVYRLKTTRFAARTRDELTYLSGTM